RASKVRSRGALTRTSWTIFKVRSSTLCAVGIMLSPWGEFSDSNLACFPCLFLGPFLHAAQLVAPVALKRRRPLVQRLNSLGIRLIELVAAIAAHSDQSDIAQHSQML